MPSHIARFKVIANGISQFRLLVSVFLLQCGLYSFAMAEDGTRFSGFGTLGISCYSSQDADFTYNTIPKGPGWSQQCDTGLDSLLGVQADALISDTLDASIQVVSQHTADDNYVPGVSVANLRWQVNDALTLRLGRVNNPLFLDSDHRQIHFSLIGVRPPVELYSISPSYTSDGIDATYRMNLHDWNFEYYAGYQQNDFRLPSYESLVNNTVYTASYRNLISLGINAEHDGWLLKAGMTQGKASYATDTLDTLFNGLRSISPDATVLASALEFRDTLVRIYTAGVRYDQDNLLMQAEVAARMVEQSFLPPGKYAGYITAGYHFGVWMPYATISRCSTTGRQVNSQVGGPLASAVSRLIVNSRENQSSFTLGASRELGRSFILKGQIQWLKPDPGNIGVSNTFNSSNYDLNNPPMDRLVSINLDFVF